MYEVEAKLCRIMKDVLENRKMALDVKLTPEEREHSLVSLLVTIEVIGMIEMVALARAAPEFIQGFHIDQSMVNLTPPSAEHTNCVGYICLLCSLGRSLPFC